MITMAETPRRYTRWTAFGTDLEADILGVDYRLIATPGTGTVTLLPGERELNMSPDEARLLGVRLIEAAALADSTRAIRQRDPDQTRQPWTPGDRPGEAQP